MLGHSCMNTENIRCVLFDLDGTLIDHFTCIYRCYCYAQEKLGLPRVSYETVLHTVGGSVPVTLERLFGKEMGAQALPLYRERFAQIMLEDIKPLPQTPEILQTLKAQGIKTAVFTNKEGSGSRAIIEHLGWMPWLDAVIGTQDTPWRKPEPEYSRYALDKLGTQATETLMVGDSPFDLLAAQAVGMPAVLVATGSHTQAQLSELSPPPLAVYPDLTPLHTHFRSLGS